MSQKKRLKAYVSGRVQGVFFRWETRKLSKELGLTGFVKNLRDGRVEVVAEGEKKKLEKLLRFLHKGPKHARVSDVDVSWNSYKDEYSSFKIAY
ncbi:MAG: acylphosphatase [Candidatus Lokiarchaeota archaeon]|nr:acylphosphatase [Candidatus Lokiarchaeota archaeon]